MTDSIFLQVEKIKKSEVTAQIGLRRANLEPIGSFQPTQLRPTMLLNVVELQGACFHRTAEAQGCAKRTFAK